MRRASALLTLLCLPGTAQAEAPLSAIDWLKEPAPITVAQPLLQPLGEPPVTGGVSVPDVTVMPLDTVRPDAVGLLPSATTGLPIGLWQASSTDTLVAQLDRLSDTPLPAIQALYYTLLLAEADPPDDAASNARFLHARIETLRRFGAVDAALALVERAGPETPVLFDDWMSLALLKGAEDAPCAALAARPELSDNYAHRVYCLARAGDWPTAALTYETARATGVLTAHEAEMLAQFLDPEAIEDAADLPPPREMTPLLFRLYEANGRPLPTRNLPREFAAADLRGTMGWRTELEAAERLARSGALPANRLLGLYTERRAAASGGIWERVRLIQRFDGAMTSGRDGEIAEALPPAWEAMHAEGLAVVFAALYGEALSDRSLPGLEALTHEIALLSPGYEQAGAKLGLQTPRARFLEGVASGTPDAALAATPTEQAIAAAFAATGPDRDYAGPLSQGRLGQVILAAAARLDTVAGGATSEIEASLATLRAVGLEDVARRAALQILLLRQS